MENINFGTKTKEYLDLIKIGLVGVFILVYCIYFTINSYRRISVSEISIISLLALIIILILVFSFKIYLFSRKSSQFELTSKGIKLRGPFVKEKFIEWGNVKYFDEVLINGYIPTISIFLIDKSAYTKTLNLLDRVSYKYNTNNKLGDIVFFGLTIGDQYNKALRFIEIKAERNSKNIETIKLKKIL